MIYVATYYSGMYLEIKKKKGTDYYYLRHNERVGGKVVPAFQKYIGTKERLFELIEQGLKFDVNSELSYTSCLHFGAVAVLFDIAKKINLRKIIDSSVKKRNQDMLISTYLICAAINRSIKAKSKRSISRWLSNTSLPNLMKNINLKKMTSQSFWDNMSLVSESHISEMEDLITSSIAEKYDLNLDVLLYDTTNYYSYIHTFNKKPTLEKRGKNKQKRADLRQVNFALLVTKDHIPLFHKVYDGNTNDYTSFQETITELKKKRDLLSKNPEKDFVLIFDAGNVSETNMNLIEKNGFMFISKLKQSNYKDLLKISTDKYDGFEEGTKLENIKVYKTTKRLYGSEKQVFIKYNKEHYEAEYLTLMNQISKTKSGLLDLEARLKGYIDSKSLPSSVTPESVENNIKRILKGRSHLKRIFDIDTEVIDGKFPALHWKLEQVKLSNYCETYLGKTIYFTNLENISSKEIIETYSFQCEIENVFKISKNRDSGCWWPKYHWTDQKIRVHAFYCYLSLLLKSLLQRELGKLGIKDEIHNVIEELHEIYEVKDTFLNKKGKSFTRRRKSKLNDLQTTVSNHFKLERYF